MSTPWERLRAITHGDRPFHDPLDPAVVDEVLAVAHDESVARVMRRRHR